MLAAAFLAVHGGELALLAAALRVLPGFIRAHGLLSVHPALESAAGFLVGTSVVLAWYGAGSFLVRLNARLGPSAADRPRARASLATARACAYGAGLWSLAWLGLGLVGAYTTEVAVAALIVGLLLTALAVQRSLREYTGPVVAAAGGRADGAGPKPRAGPASAVALALVVVALGMALLAALAPPTAKDSLQYHVALPKAFVAAGALVVVPDNIASYFPLAVEMQSVWAMLLGRALSARIGEAALSVVAFAYFPLLLAAVYGWARERGLDRAWASTATALVATVPAAWEVAAGAYVDLALALHVTLAVRAAARWWTTREPVYLAGVAVAGGFALGVKLLAMVPVLVTGLIVLVAARRAGPAIAAAALATPAVAVAIGSPWYLRTWALTGSPLFPFYLDVWPAHAPGWDAARSVMLRGFNELYGGFPKGPLDYLLAPIRLSLLGQREIPAYYEGVLGVAFLIGGVLLVQALWRRRLEPEAGVIAAAGTALVLWWALSVQVLRYTLAALPPLAVASAMAGSTLARAGSSPRTLRAALLVPAAAAALVTATWFLADAPFLAALGAEPRDAYLARRLDYYPYYRLINDGLPGGSTVWLINARRDAYHLERPFVGDYLFEDYTIRRWVREARDPAELRARARAAGITHVFVRHDVLLDYARSSVVDDRLPEAENRARLARLRAFLLDGTRVLRADPKFLLVELPRG